ncbi:MAG: sugar phosphate nucleotidyltransferase [Alphaproteobacteria bacterium]
MQIESAIILSAGFGKRLSPLTDHTPKPLVEVGGVPVLSRVLGAIKNYGSIRHVVLNSHHLATQIDAYMKGVGANILGDISYDVIYEPTILETGGGVKNALPLLSSTSLPFLVINGDGFLQNGDGLHRLSQHFDEKKMAGLLALVEKKNMVAISIKHGDFKADAMHHGAIPIERDGGDDSLVFCGVQILTSQLFADMKGDVFSLNKIYDRAITKMRLYGLLMAGKFFTIGTLADITLAEKNIDGVKNNG